MEYLNLSYKLFTVPTDAWYNLNTNHVIKSKKENIIYIDNPRIAGNINILYEFYKLNNLKVPDNVVPSPTSKSIINTELLDIDQLNDEDLKAVNEFSFDRLFCKAKVDKVIDGDTVDLFIYIPLSMLTNKYAARKNKDVCYMANVLSNSVNDDVKMLFKLRCRLFGIDTADIDKNKKLRGKEYLESLVQKLNNIVYCHFRGREFHGRELVELYTDANREHSICQQILEYDDPVYSKLAYKYYGGTKIKH